MDEDRLKDWEPLFTSALSILDAAAIAAYNRPFREGDYLALIAMHIMTKEQPAWTFQSLWWHDRPNDGPYAADRPPLSPLQAPGPWRHYLMTSTYGIPAQPGGKTWPVAYNPYIELAGDHPIRSNCMNCHHRAAWPGKQSSYEAPGGPGPLDIYKPGPSIFKVLLLDSQWSMSNRAGPPFAENAEPSARRAGQRCVFAGCLRERDDVDVTRGPIYDAEQIQGGAANDDDAEPLAVGGEQLADGLEGAIDVRVVQHDQ